MKITSRLLLATTFVVTLGFSGIVSGISVIINDKPITLYEVYKYSTQFKIDKNQALDLLIRQKLEDDQINKLGISANKFEVDQYIENIATKNGMNQFEFFNMLKLKNIKEETYKSDLTKKLQRDKLYSRIYSNSNQIVEEKDLQKYYKENINQFKMAGSFDLSIYTSTNKNSLTAIQSNPMLRPADVNVKEESIDSKGLNKKLYALLNSTKEGSFTQILNIENKATMFFVKKIKNVNTVSYEKAKSSINQIVSRVKKQKVISDYFEKLKSSASIKMVRNPS